MIGRIPMIRNGSSVRKYNITKRDAERFLRLFGEFKHPFDIDCEVSGEREHSVVKFRGPAVNYLEKDRRHDVDMIHIHYQSETIAPSPFPLLLGIPLLLAYRLFLAYHLVLSKLRIYNDSLFQIQGRKDLIDEVAVKLQSFLENPPVKDPSVCFASPLYDNGNAKTNASTNAGERDGLPSGKIRR